MTNYQEVIDNILGFLAFAQPARNGQASEWAAEYARVCEEANDRLRRCEDALRRGLRADAIQLAETEPNLLDLVAALDFPDLPKWREACARFELPGPPSLRIESATALNEAYAAEQPLQGVLDCHRVMALARAPISERLIVMRRIAELDPASSFWADDIRAYERARLIEIRSQLSAAIRANDVAVVTRLRDETSDPAWRLPVPPDLRQSLEDAAANLAAARGSAQLRDLLPKLNEAYGAMAYQECKSLAGQWLAIIAAARLTVPRDLQEQVDPVFGWVQEQDDRRIHEADFAQSCISLQQAIDTDQPTPAIETAYQATLQFHLDLPVDLEARYRQRLAARANAIRHRRRLLYVAIAAGFMVVAGGLTLIAYQILLTREVSESQKTLTLAQADVQNGDIDKGQSLRRELIDQHPRIQRSPLILSALTDFDNAVVAERQRQTDFRKHIQAAVSAGVERPDASEFQLASSMAKTAAEIAQVAQWKDQIDEFRARKQQETDKQFAAGGSAISDELEKNLTPEALAADPDGYEEQIRSFKGKVDDLEKLPLVSARLKEAQIAALSAAISQKQDAFQRQATQSKAWQQVRNFGSSASAHADAIKQFVTACPDDPHCASFEQAAAQLKAEEAIEDWSSIAKLWSTHLMPENYASAKQRAAEVQDYLDHHAETPLSDPVKSYLAYLNKGLEAASDDGPWKAKFRKLISNPLVGDLRCLDTTDNVRYYVTDAVNVKEGVVEGVVKSQSFDAVTSPDMTRPTIVMLHQGGFLKSSKPSASPQMAFAEAAGTRLDVLDYNGWDEVGIDLLQDLLNRREINPILHAILLQHTLQLIQAAAPEGDQEAIAKVADLLVRLNVEDIEWLDPRHPPDPEVLKKLRSAVDKLPPMPATRTELVHRREAMLNAIQITVVGEGILLRSGDGYEIVSSANPVDGQVAWVVGPKKDIVEVGHVANKHWELQSADVRYVPEGSLVFVLAERKQP